MFKVILANPNKTHIIAEAKIKNDREDAGVLADLVRADLVAESYVPTATQTRAYGTQKSPRGTC